MRFLLDTDVVSNLVRQRQDPGLRRWLNSKKPADLAVPVGVIFEIQLGIERLRREQKSEKAIFLERWLESLICDGKLEIIPISVGVARKQAELYTTPALRNFFTPRPGSTRVRIGIDLVIAATAIVHGFAIATFNLKDYQRIHALPPLPGVLQASTGEGAASPQTQPVTPN